MANFHSTITFGLVNIPIIMNPIIKNNDTSFNQLHKKCHERIRYLKYCPFCKKNVTESDIIKGYEYEKDKYVIFTKEELNKLKPEQEKEIEIIAFVPINQIDPTYFEKSYSLNYDGGKKAFTLFCEALKQSKLVALAKTVIGTKFYYCILRVLNQNIIMTTLYFASEVNLPESETKKEINKKELDMALKLIENLKSDFEPEKYKDEYQENISSAINKKLDGKTIKGTKKKNKEQITDLMKALERSLKEK